MSKYFFHIHDGADGSDDQGHNLPDLGAAQQLAAEYLGAVIRDTGAVLFSNDEVRMDVTDQHGLILFTAHVFCNQAAALPARSAAAG